MGWTNHEYVVTATDTNTRIRFVSLVAGTAGPALDAVSLTVVSPPPTAYSVVVGNAGGSVTSAVARVEFDTDNNGLPDSWERTYFGGLGQDPNADSDGDGVSNLQEYLDGTNPTNAASFRPRLYLAGTPGGLETASPFQASFALNDTVQIMAVPNPGSLFNGWVGSITNTNPVVNVVMSGNETITALYGQTLVNGANYAGLMSPGSSNRFAFNGAAGDSIQIRAGSVGFTPRIDVFGPDGSLAGQFAVNNANYQDADVFLRLTNSGLFAVVVGSYYAGGTGTFGVNLAQAPEAFVVSPGDEGGALTNGTINAAALGLGDQDMWTFAANPGDSIQLRAGAVGFTPRIDLYGPDGSLTGQFAVNNAGYRDADVFLRLTNGGAYTAVISSYFLNGSGTYTVSLAQAPEAFTVSPGDTGGVLTNGAINPGTLAVGGQDMWLFTGNPGDSIQVRVGTVGFTPRIDLYGPDGSLAGQFAVNNGSYRDADVFLRLTNGGMYTVVVSSYFINGTGNYNLSLAQAPEAFTVSPGDTGGVLTNGTINPGTIGIGGQDMWTFTGSAGDSIQLRAGTAGFTPQIDLYGPDGSLAGQFAVNNGNYNDGSIFLRLTNSGRFTVVISSYFINGTGTYNLNLAQAPETFVVSPGDAGGTLVNGAMNPGVINVGGQDMWTFMGNAGDAVQLRMGTVGFTPRLDLYGPDGSPAGQFAVNNGTYNDAQLITRLTNGGRFTLVASSYLINGSGSYTLNLAQAPEPFVVSPGDEGGVLTNGALNVAILALGDMDMWSFTANAGDSIQLRVGTAGFTPRIDLYGPGGALAGQYAANVSSSDAFLDLPLTNSGTYVAVISSYYINGSGMYELNLAQAPEPFVISPQDEGGPLTNGGNHDGITALGDVDQWTFTANAGDNIVLRCGELSGTAGYSINLRLYGPTGALLATNANASDAFIAYQATNGGQFMVMVDSLTANNTGSYRLRFAKIPGAYIVPAGDEGGVIAGGTTNNAATDLGDEDIWNFTAFKGALITLNAQKLSGAAGYNPWIRLYGPGGAPLTNAFSATTATINYIPTNSGNFTLLVGSHAQGSTGTYALSGAGFSAGLKLNAPAIAGTNLVVAGGGGGSNVTYVLLGTTNLAQPTALWTPLATNHFDASGGFSFTNLFTPGAGSKYFKLSLP